MKNRRGGSNKRIYHSAVLKNFRYFFLFLLISSCIEPYDFIVHDDTHTLVVEAYISDRSFAETLLYPSDGRYFTAKLSYTSDVINVRPTMITASIVSLTSDQGEEWIYTESTDKPGVYELIDNDFKAQKNVKYKLKVSLPDDNLYESEWEELPAVETPMMGDIGFTETTIQRYIVEASKNVLRTVKGITANVNVTENPSGKQIFYRWEYTPTWIYIAPLVSVSDPGYRCWASSKDYIPDYALQIDNAGGYGKNLFFLETVRNERLFEDFSVLVMQYSMNEMYYTFWREMQEQAKGGAIFDSPPFNLHTNLRSLDGTTAVSGYFGMVQEQAKRTYFNIDDLSYNVINTLKGDCLVVYGPDGPAPECLDCREYSFGTTTTEKPSWWRQ